MLTTLIRRNGCTPASMSDLFTGFFSDPIFAGLTGQAVSEGEGVLALDVSEDASNVYVRASLPGFTREQIDVQVHEGVLTITATRNEQSEQGNERYFRRERRMGTVTRRVVLPESVAEGDAHAELKDGVLTLRFAKTPESQPRKIAIG